MAYYGVSPYGLSSYGSITGSSGGDLSAAPFLVVPRIPNSAGNLDTAYGYLHLTWTVPPATYTGFRLVRNTVSLPTSESDGTVLIDTTKASAPTYLVDGPLTGGKSYYYSLWVYGVDGGTAWVRVGDATGIALSDFGYEDALLERLPTVFTSGDAEVGGVPDTTGQLARYLGLFGRELNYTRTLAETLLTLRDPLKIPAPLLPLLAATLGVPYEPQLGDRTNRALIRDYVHLCKVRGTAKGVEGVASAYTGYGATVHVGHNLLHDYNTANFEEGVGLWAAVSQCTIARAASDTGVAPETSSGSYPSGPRTAGMLVVSATGSAPTWGFSVTAGTLTQATTGIPVTGNHSYIVSAQIAVPSGQTAKPVRIDTLFFDGAGTLLSTVTGTATLPSVGAFAAATLTTCLPTAPANAVFAGLKMTVDTGVNTEKYYVDRLVFADLSCDYYAGLQDEARAVIIELAPTRSNLSWRPNWEASDILSKWSPFNATLAAVTSGTMTPFVGTKCGEITPTVNGSATASYTLDNIGANAPGVDLSTTVFTLSLWLRSTVSRNAVVEITYYDASNTLLSTLSGALVATSTTQWQQHTVQHPGFVPVGTTSARVQVRFPTVATTDRHYIGGQLQELGNVARTYFDAGVYAAATGHASDYVWESGPGGSAANLGPSHYYVQLTSAKTRLSAVLSSWVPAGSSWYLTFGQPAAEMAHQTDRYWDQYGDTY